MTLLRLLNWQGVVGIAASLCLAVLLVLQMGETRHWKKQSGQFEQLYERGQSALATTVASYRVAADAARRADQANASRIAAAQRTINERTSNDYQARLAAARAAAQRVHRAAQPAAADPRAGGDAPVPGLAAAPGGAAQAAAQDRLSRSDALTATEQAIQLDELIKWVKAQADVDPNRN
jgi:hypothetical protein